MSASLAWVLRHRQLSVTSFLAISGWPMQFPPGQCHALASDVFGMQ